jgi:hypothetical protein
MMSAIHHVYFYARFFFEKRKNDRVIDCVAVVMLPNDASLSSALIRKS